MIENQIRELRNKLNDAINNNQKHDIIMELSYQLDNLILKYYRNTNHFSWKLYKKPK